MTKKILITDEVHSLLVDGLSNDGFTVDYKPKITPAEVLDTIHEYEGLIVNSKVYVGPEMFDRAALLKFVCRAGSGLEVIDLNYARYKNVIAFNSPEGNRMAVAEHALGMLLGLMNNLCKADSEVRRYEWIREPNRGYELSGKTVALIAYGNTAQAFAKLLSGFDVKILAYDKYYHGFSNKQVTEASMETIFDQADVLSLHLPLTGETNYMIDYDFLIRFKKPYWFINTSRGKVLRTADLIKAMNEGRIIGSALDVLENEKINQLSAEEKTVFEQLIAKQNILLSPHIAGWTHESKIRIATILLEKIRNIYTHQ
jgi:D-3-phosphoglycerate dehydrogenase